MAPLNNKIPKRHGEFFFDPAFPLWKEDAYRNRERLVKGVFWGQNALKVRAELKLPTDHPLILTGHQPVFYHPGLWAKCLTASLLAEAVQGTACHKITDTALSPEHLHYMPEVEENGKARRQQIDFFQNKDLKKDEKTMPYAFLPPPDFSALEKIFGDAQVFSPPSVKKNIKEYEEKIKIAPKDYPTWNDFHLYTLNLLDGFSGTQRLYMTASKLWESEPFIQFLTYWFTNLPELTEHYNQALNDYRKKYQIKHKMTPISNLRFENWWFEVPFWAVTKFHQRHSLWAKKEGKHFMLKTKGAEGTYSVEMEDFRGGLGVLPISIWPKAMPQTLFCRFYLCDYFIHGVGGSAYEEVNDIFFERLFKLKPLSFGTVTATYYIEPQDIKGVENILNHEAKIQWWERALTQNPEYLFTRREVWERDLPSFMLDQFRKCFDNEDLRKLANEKQVLLENLKDPARKADAAARIKDVNFSLFDGYTEILRALENGLLDVERVRQLKDVLSYREYPFFCYSPDVFTEMYEKLRVAAHKE